MRNIKRVIFILAIAIYASLGVSAQEIAGSIRGTVQDASGATVSGARVTALQTETGLVRTATTDSQGSYILVGDSYIFVHANRRRALLLSAE